MEQFTLDYLAQRFEISKQMQIQRGVKFALTFPEYLKLWRAKPRHVRRLTNTIRRGTVDRFMRSPDGFVLTWLDKRDRLAGLMHAGKRLTLAEIEVLGMRTVQLA